MNNNITFHKDFDLPTNGEIFVFGSNLAGVHGAGAAKIAKEKYGAIWGVEEGFVGSSFAIPTKNRKIQTLPIVPYIERNVKEFIRFTQFHPSMKFFVTRVGCGLAGYSDSQIAPLFVGAINCSFPEEWREFLS